MGERIDARIIKKTNIDFISRFPVTMPSLTILFYQIH